MPQTLHQILYLHDCLFWIFLIFQIQLIGYCHKYENQQELKDTAENTSNKPCQQVDDDKYFEKNEPLCKKLNCFELDWNQVRDSYSYVVCCYPRNRKSLKGIDTVTLVTKEKATMHEKPNHYKVKHNKPVKGIHILQMIHFQVNDFIQIMLNLYVILQKRYGGEQLSCWIYNSSLYNKMEGNEQQVVLMKKYKLLEKIGSGSFGSIYRCQSLENNEHYAAKIEKKGKGDGQLQYEIKLYQLFQGIPGIVKLYDFGNDPTHDRIFMVIDLLGKSLEDLFQQCEKRFSIATALNIGIQIITRLEMIHRKGFVHRDIKANNFMMGRGEKAKIVYIIDFGLAKRYFDPKTNKHIPVKGGKSLVGTARYASIASHEGFQQCRRDDLESLGYLLLYFLRGKLPWQGVQIQNKVQKYAQIGRMKKQARIDELCLQLGEDLQCLVRYFQYVKGLAFEQTPDYDLLRKLFKETLVKRGEENSPLTWDVKGQNKKI